MGQYDSLRKAAEENLFEQITNISKSHGYDILVEQVGELKKENAKLREALQDIVTVAVGKENDKTKVIELRFERGTLLTWLNKAKEAMKQTKFS